MLLMATFRAFYFIAFLYFLINSQKRQKLQAMSVRLGAGEPSFWQRAKFVAARHGMR